MGEEIKPIEGTTGECSEAPLSGGGLALAEESPTAGAGENAAASDAVTETGEMPAPAGDGSSGVSAERHEALLKEKQDLYDRLLRKQAEFENFRKRTEREKIESYDFAVANFVLGLLPALDGLERGLSVTEGETVENYKKGIELILKQLRDQLSAAGVQPIRATGKMFDPNFHQAVMREESSVLPENEVIEEMQRGYTFKDRLLRPSMVKVAVAPSPPAEEEPAVPLESVESEPEAAG